jgi:hypothetical protein
MSPPRLFLPDLEAVTDADRAWFEAYPGRRYHLRPTALAELLPGEAIGPGSRMVVWQAAEGVRFRLRVGRPPLRLRHDTDRCCRELIRRVERAGYTLNGIPLREAFARIAENLAAEAVSALAASLSLGDGCHAAILPTAIPTSGGPA